MPADSNSGTSSLCFYVTSPCVFFMWWLPGKPNFSLVSSGLPWCVSQEREARGCCIAFSNLISEVMQSHFHCIIFTKSESVGPTHFQRGRQLNSATLASKNFQTCFQTRWLFSAPCGVSMPKTFLSTWFSASRRLLWAFSHGIYLVRGWFEAEVSGGLGSNWQNIIFPTFYRSSWSQVQSRCREWENPLSSDVKIWKHLWLFWIYPTCPSKLFSLNPKS